MVTYNPYIQFARSAQNFGGSVQGPEIVSTFQQPYGNSLIMDLKDGNVFEFEAPYVSAIPYMSYYNSTGAVTVVCMDPLQSTGTVTPTVPLLVEICGGDDFELADFAGVQYPILPSGTIYTQSGGNPINDTITNPSPTTIGERMMSAKQMIQMPAASKYLATVASGISRFYVVPWFVNSSFVVSDSAKALPNPVNTPGQFQGATSVGGILSKCYAFAKGSTDYHIYPSYADTDVSIVQNSVEFQGLSGLNGTGTLNKRPFTSNTPCAINRQGMALHARMPSYQVTARIPTHFYDTNFVGDFPTQVFIAPPILTHYYKALVDPNQDDILTVHRSAGDDAALAHYIGPVPVFIPNAASTIDIDPYSTSY
jgi:hypothetical protein